MVVAAALAGRVDFLVSLDRHLLDLAGLPGLLVRRCRWGVLEVRAVGTLPEDLDGSG